MPRLFFGVTIPAAVRGQVAELQSALKRLGVRAGNWSAPDLFHITVLFLGELDASHRPWLDEVGEFSARQVAPFQLTVSHVGSFERNRVLWLGVESDAGCAALAELHRAVSSKCQENSALALDARPYRPHLTLARKLDVASYHTARSSIPGEMVRLVIPVEHLCLFESRREGGRLVYPVLRRFALSRT
jgi:2'-5' RNA ligase